MDFSALVAALMSNDNAARKQAEAAYEAVKAESAPQLVLQLVALVRSSPDAETRAFAPVLLRPLIEIKAGVFDKLDAQTQLTGTSSLSQLRMLHCNILLMTPRCMWFEQSRRSCWRA